MEAALAQRAKSNVGHLLDMLVSHSTNNPKGSRNHFQFDTNLMLFLFQSHTIIRFLYGYLLRFALWRNLLWRCTRTILCFDWWWWLPLSRWTVQMRRIRGLCWYVVCTFIGHFLCLVAVFGDFFLMHDSCAIVTGYCASVCCDPSAEETCLNFDTWEPESCALIANGGCPCPYEQVKCGAFDGYAGTIVSILNEKFPFILMKYLDWTDGRVVIAIIPGYCSPVCCDDEIEETCHSTYSGRAESCALISEGGCTCPDGEIKCNSFGGDSGETCNIRLNDWFILFHVKC